MPETDFLTRILADVREIPPLPEVAAKVMRMTNDPDVSAAELNRVISTDEALTANILKMCNSAYYGLPRVISSVTQAIMYLGFQTVRNMVLSSAVDQIYQKQDLESYNYQKNGLSDHSISVAVAAQVISKNLRPGLADTAYTAGLLHDVGKIVLAKYVRENIDKLREISNGQRITLEAEREVFGLDHAQVGAQIADSWNFPQELTLAIGYHHHPEDAKGRPLLAVITYLANIVCLRLGHGLASGPLDLSVSPFCAEATGYDENSMPELGKQVEEALEALKKTGERNS